MFGIVADSIPEKEYQETVNKAQALIKSIEMNNSVITGTGSFIPEEIVDNSRSPENLRKKLIDAIESGEEPLKGVTGGFRKEIIELALKDKYADSINNCLHLLWLKSFKNSTSLVEILHGEKQELIEDFAGKLYAKLNPTFCILPWMHVQYKPNGQSKLCCRFDTVHEYNQYKKLTEAV